eukprot:306335_1
MKATFSNYDGSYNMCFEQTLTNLKNSQIMFQIAEAKTDPQQDSTDPNQKSPKHIRDILRCEMKFEFLVMMQETVIISLDELIFLHDKKYGVFTRRTDVKRFLLTELPVAILDFAPVNSFQTVQPTQMVVLTQYPDNNWNVYVYKLVECLLEMAQNLQKQNNNLKNNIASQLYNLFAKYKFYNQHLICTDLRTIMYNIFD